MNDANNAAAIAWVVTALLGCAAGVGIGLLYRLISRATGFRALSRVLSVVLAAFALIPIDVIRHRIAEAPFEEQGLYIYPSRLSVYLPALFLLAGAFATARALRREPRSDDNAAP